MPIRTFNNDMPQDSKQIKEKRTSPWHFYQQKLVWGTLAPSQREEVSAIRSAWAEERQESNNWNKGLDEVLLP